MKLKTLAAAASVTLTVAIAPANASLIASFDGTAGDGFTTITLSGSSTVNQNGTIRSSGSDFSIGDTFEPDANGDFISTNAISNDVFAVTGNGSITIGGTTETITQVFLDDDGSSRDDFGIRTLNTLSYLAGEASSWVGQFTIGVDYSSFNEGIFRLNSTQSNGGGFLFAGVDDVIIEVGQQPISAVPLPASAILLFGALGGLGTMSRRKKV